MRIATASDSDMSALVDAIHNGFPDMPSAMSSAIRMYHQYRDKLTEYDGVILYKDRIVIPPTLRAGVLQALHSAHQGVSMMVSRAEGSFFWHGMTPAIEETRARCTACNRMAPSQPNTPPTPPIRPVYPFQAICADYFSYSGHHYLVAVDRYSNWPIVEENAEGSKCLIAALRRVFVTFGIAEELSSDGGPEFMAGATETFLRNWGVHHRVSSVAHPHSNCRAELGVKTVERMLVGSTGPGGSLNTDAFQRAMLSLQKHTRSDVEGQPRRDHLWTPHSRLHSCTTWTVSSTLDLARNTGSQGGCATCPTHEGTLATVRAHTCSTSTGHRKLCKAAESGWSPSNQMGPNRNRCRSATV